MLTARSASPTMKLYSVPPIGERVRNPQPDAMPAPESISIIGCRHDLYGHALKAYGILRALNVCAADGYADADAEAWWDTNTAVFYLRSPKYPTEADLIQFFEQHYRPTPIFSPWNKDCDLPLQGETIKPPKVPKKRSKNAVGVGQPGAVSTQANQAYELAARFYSRFQSDEGDAKFNALFLEYRDLLPQEAVHALDAVAAAHVRANDANPVFLKWGKGGGGRAETFRKFSEHYLAFRKNPAVQVQAALAGNLQAGTSKSKNAGAPFFPDCIKTYNNGTGWILEAFPFCALDYVLALEGALALRGSAARLLGARNGNFAAFPFIFETADDMTDKEGKVRGTALSLWLPVWNRPVTFAELESFILDSQARLPGREVRFTAEFVRAVRSQGVDAGFAGYQEFRFKMIGSNVPWVCTGRYLATDNAKATSDAAELLRPLEDVAFLDQLDLEWNRKGEVTRSSPHRFRAKILDAIENAVSEGEPLKFLAVLEQIFQPMRLSAISKGFRQVVNNACGHDPVMPPPLPQEPWLEALRGLEAEPEFEIALALASIQGKKTLRDGKWLGAEPFLGSILPLTLGRRGWYLPQAPEPPSPQAVWSGRELSFDLARVLWRRYHDSCTHDRPALASPFPARLPTILRFLHGELDDTRIARWAEALSLIGWHPSSNQTESWNRSQEMAIEESSRPLPLAYAAIRSLLETELVPSAGDAERRRCVSSRTLALLRERSGAGAAAATEEALHRLSIVGVRNPYDQTQKEKPHLAGRDIVRIQRSAFLVADPDISRLAAAVCIPLHWRDRFRLFRNVTLPQTKEFNENI